MTVRFAYFLFFVFFKQKTAYEMRISDWSSDVCSSDLGAQVDAIGLGGGMGGNRQALGHLQAALLEGVEGHVQRHHLGQRCRVARGIRVLGIDRKSVV